MVRGLGWGVFGLVLCVWDEDFCLLRVLFPLLHTKRTRDIKISQKRWWWFLSTKAKRVQLCFFWVCERIATLLSLFLGVNFLFWPLSLGEEWWIACVFLDPFLTNNNFRDPFNGGFFVAPGFLPGLFVRILRTRGLPHQNSDSCSGDQSSGKCILTLQGGPPTSYKWSEITSINGLIIKWVSLELFQPYLWEL